MIAILFRVAMLTVGLAAVEVGLVPVPATGAAGGWALVLVGLPLIVAGSASFIGPLLGATSKGGTKGA